MKKWTSEEITILKSKYEKVGVIKLSKELCRSYYSVHKKAMELELNYKNKTWKNEIDFLVTDESAIITYESIIKTFNLRQQELAFNYIKARLMRKQGLKLRDIANELKVSEQTLRGWSSKTTPRAIRCVIKLTKLNLLPLVLNNTPEFELFLKIFGWIFGDGNINNLQQITLVGNKPTIKLLRKETKLIFPFIGHSIKTIKTNGEFQGRKIVGEGTNLIINDAAFSRLLYAAGAPKGNKTIQSIKIPIWLINADRKLKSIFLGALWSTDGSKPVWGGRGFYLCVKFNKSLRFKNEHEIFLNSIRELLREFDITTSEIKWKERPYKRKDGEIVDSAYFYVSTKAENFLRFCKEIPIFNIERKIEFEDTLLKIRNKLENREDRRVVYAKVKELSRNGKSIREVSETLNLPYSTAKVWIRGIHKPI